MTYSEYGDVRDLTRLHRRSIRGAAEEEEFLLGTAGSNLVLLAPPLINLPTNVSRDRQPDGINYMTDVSRGRFECAE